ncbi:MAG TPA: GNAT family N-acetyltransferase [Candidatus Limnocylindrales bacterium]|nr:GNAT family N-acetyltransferase [Candidatus Limnocylindrales bacterium]
MPDDAIQLRQPTAETLRAWVEPVAAAFGETFTDAEFEHDRDLFELDRLIGAVDGETWVGAGGAYSFRLTIPGGEIPAAGITMIGVAPTHRRRGILRSMMRWLLEQAHERGEPVSILYATEAAIYPNFGFGLASLTSSLDIDPRRTRFARQAQPLGRIRFVEQEEALRLMPPVYDAIRDRTPGAISRDATKWRVELVADTKWWSASGGPKFMAVLEVDGVVRGYAIYRVKNEWGDRGPNNTLLVLEVTGLDPAAERALWEWLLSIDLVGRIKVRHGPVPHPLTLQVTEPRQLGMTFVRDGLWLRILDVAAALEARSYAAAGSLTLELTDEFCPWNAARWRIEVSRGDESGARGVATVSATNADADLTLDTTDLAATYLGGFTFTDLARAGRVGERRPGAVEAADAMFATVVKPWCSTGF